MLMEISILCLLILVAIGLGYLIYIQRNLVVAKDIEIMQQTALKNNAHDERLKVQELNSDLWQQVSAAQKYSLKAMEDRELLVGLMKIVWDARDTKAAEQCVRNLVGPSDDGHHYTIEECYTHICQALGFEGIAAADGN